MKVTVAIGIFLWNLYKSAWAWVKSHKWKSIGVAALTFFGFATNLLGWWSFAAAKADVRAMLSAVSTSQESIERKIDSSEADIRSDIKSAGKITCRNLQGGDWVLDDSVATEGQYVFLKDGQKAGSIRLFGSFADTFVLKFVFIPSAVEGTNTAFSIKDEHENELIMSFADEIGVDDSDTNFDNYKVTFKNASGTKEISGPGNSRIVPSVKNDSEVTFQLQTSQQAYTLFANAFLIYTPSKKPNETVPLDLFKEEIPYFLDRSVRLHVGVRRNIDTSQPKIAIVDCEVKETDF